MPVDFDPIVGRLSRRSEFLGPNVLDPALYSSLSRIRRACERVLVGFPYGKCIYTATLVKEQTGLSRVAGFYRDPNPDHHGQKYDHAWNRTDTGLYVDLTHDQFDAQAPGITILAPDCEVLEPAHIVAQRSFLQSFQLPEETHASLLRELKR